MAAAEPAAAAPLRSSLRTSGGGRTTPQEHSVRFALPDQPEAAAAAPAAEPMSQDDLLRLVGQPPKPVDVEQKKLWLAGLLGSLQTSKQHLDAEIPKLQELRAQMRRSVRRAEREADIALALNSYARSVNRAPRIFGNPFSVQEADGSWRRPQPNSDELALPPWARTPPPGAPAGFALQRHWGQWDERDHLNELVRLHALRKRERCGEDAAALSPLGPKLPSPAEVASGSMDFDWDDWTQVAAALASAQREGLCQGVPGSRGALNCMQQYMMVSGVHVTKPRRSAPVPAAGDPSVPDYIRMCQETKRAPVLRQRNASADCAVPGERAEVRTGEWTEGEDRRLLAALTHFAPLLLADYPGVADCLDDASALIPYLGDAAVQRVAPAWREIAACVPGRTPAAAQSRCRALVGGPQLGMVFTHAAGAALKDAVDAPDLPLDDDATFASVAAVLSSAELQRMSRGPTVGTLRVPPVRCGKTVLPTDPSGAPGAALLRALGGAVLADYDPKTGAAGLQKLTDQLTAEAEADPQQQLALQGMRDAAAAGLDPELRWLTAQTIALGGASLSACMMPEQAKAAAAPRHGKRKRSGGQESSEESEDEESEEEEEEDEEEEEEEDGGEGNGAREEAAGPQSGATRRKPPQRKVSGRPPRKARAREKGSATE
eukprot:TRINITY_DN10650_c0_g1_i1.p1 TRINITY_DN10650_c0_g1~~TRINITY_DN10650_c0_g1_i1.p1  ORF type:complete len:661 (+),score=155.35 TRINITY_DN10650_c0_g1_i1:126-2108(+)